MQDPKKRKNFKKFYYGLGIFLFSASTVAFVTDPFVMADIGLIILGIYLMVTRLMEMNASAHKE